MSLFGILNVFKPAGRTSRAVVDQIERLTRPAKAGHAGTLDPLATGVLVICVGQATRLIRYVQRMPKRYRATFLLGKRSDTDDVEGAVEEVPDTPIPSRRQLDQILSKFTGQILQRPPAHSAVKVSGQRAYKLARAGKGVELAARPVTIHRLEIRSYEYPELEMEIECSSGTYVRSLGRDLAELLGTGAVMSALERTAIGRFRVDEAVKIDELTAETLPNSLQPALCVVADLQRVYMSDRQLTEIRHGRPIPKPEAPVSLSNASNEWTAVVGANNLVAILIEKHPGQLWPIKNFF